MGVKIQMKVYDEAGKRVEVVEVMVPVSAAHAAEYIIKECKRLGEAPYPPLKEAEKL
jgi:hypothetical protein